MKFRKRDFLASNAYHKNARYVLAAALISAGLIPGLSFVEQHREQKGTRIVISAVAFLQIGHGENRVLKYTGAIRHPEKMIKAQWRKPIRLRGERLVREGPSSDRAPASRSRIAKRFHVAPGHHGPSHLPAEQISALAHLI